jgi:hypothetical protein
MTEEELRQSTSPKSGFVVIMGPNMKDVAFWPLSIQITPTHYELNGIWYSNVLQDLMSAGGNKPARETIKIKKEDLAGWTIVEKNKD